MARRRLTPKEEVENRAIIDYLKGQGVNVNDDGTVTLYHVTSRENAESIRKNGFRGTNAPIGGMTGAGIGPRSFFGFSKEWVEQTWGSGGDYETLEIRVPAYYIRQGAKNEKEVYIEGNIRDTGDNVWEPDVKPVSTFYDRRAVKRYLKNNGFTTIDEAAKFVYDQGARNADSALSAMEKRIRSVYAEAQKDIEKKTKDFWDRHRVKDAAYRKQLAEGKITEEQYQSWMRGQVFQGKQWDAKLQQIESTLAQANKDALEIINGGRIQVFTDNSNWAAYSIEHGAGLNFGFNVYDADAVTRLLRDDPNLLPAKKLNVPKDKIWNKGNINRQISQGIIQGESLDRIAKRLRNVTDMNKSQSLTNARTMMTGAQNAGRQESYARAQKMGIELQKEWLATLDGHTRANHAALDGQAVDIDKPFKIGPFTIAYPGDPHAHPSMVYGCRCTTIARLVKYPHKGKRYDNIAGKPVKDMTYQQWIKAKTVPQFTQISIGKCKTVQEVADLINASGRFITASNLDGCDLNSAKAIASAYQQTIEKFPQLSGKIGGVTAKKINNRAYAQCYLRSKRIEVNTDYYNDWDRVQNLYERDIEVGWHPSRTTAEAIVTHEIGHAIDGILSDAYRSWDYKNSRISKTFANGLRAKVAQSTGVKIKDMGNAVSTYASQNAQEWFAECYAEYITSANPGRVAKRFGQLLEEELKKI